MNPLCRVCRLDTWHVEGLCKTCFYAEAMSQEGLGAGPHDPALVNRQNALDGAWKKMLAMAAARDAISSPTQQGLIIPIITSFPKDR